MGVRKRMWERFKPAWWAWVGAPLALLLLAALAQWLLGGCNESAWDHMTASDGYYAMGLVGLALLLALWHFLHASRDVFVAHRERGLESEGALVSANAEKEQLQSELEKAREKAKVAAQARSVSMDFTGADFSGATVNFGPGGPETETKELSKEDVD